MKITVGKNWTIIYNSLSMLDPEENNLTPKELEYAILGFTQDLVQIESKERQFLIDIGWSPDIDINGEFLLQMFPIKDGDCDWFNPIVEFKTRSLKQLILKIEELTHQNKIQKGCPNVFGQPFLYGKGIVTEISNRSGHYQPSQELNSQVINELKLRGINTNKIKITGF